MSGQNPAASVPKARYALLDALRGLCVISMVCYHAMYDFVYIEGHYMSWFPDTPGYVWQQSICWTFILLSGLCWKLSRRHWQRGLVLAACGGAATLVTYLAMPSELIQYGVLTLLGLSALLLIPLDKLCRRLRVPAWAGLLLSAGLFFLTRGVPKGYLGFEGLRFLELPAALYGSDVFAVLGFPSPAFMSTDYFPLIPWFFLYLSGYFLWGLLCKSRQVLGLLKGPDASHSPLLYSCCRPLAFVGRHSLLIYLLHQPVILLLFMMI